MVVLATVIDSLVLLVHTDIVVIATGLSAVCSLKYSDAVMLSLEFEFARIEKLNIK